MNIAEFEQLVLDYLNRAGVSFDIGAEGRTDKVLFACNNAKQFAQRKIKFESAITYVTLQVSKSSGGDLSTALLFSDEATPIKIRSITHGFVEHSNESWVPVAVRQRGPQLEEFRKNQYVQIQTERYPKLSRIAVASVPELVKDGGTIWLTPWPQADIVVENDSTTVKLRVYQWMPPYKEPNDSDFFLDFCQDWLLYRCIQELNFYLKEDQRVQISQSMVQSAFESMQQWNSENATMENDLDLD